MGFYEQIAKYYDVIFPTGEEQIDFIKRSSGVPPKKILDVACGTGSYSITLAKMGYDLCSVDIDKTMIEALRDKAKAQKISVKAYIADMIALNRIINEKFNTVFCIGNSIVHLSSIEEIAESIEAMKSVLYEDGILLLQIINFDRIFSKNITSLPTIYDGNSGVEFIRNYNYTSDSKFVNFDTVLTVKNDNNENIKYKNSVKLFPLLSVELYKILKNAGFNKIDFYGDFSGNEYKAEDSYTLVVKAVL